MNLGVDIVRIKRFQALKKGDFGHWRHVFTRKEWDWAFKKARAAEHLAGIFAAKEAAFKASGARSRALSSFEVLHAKPGKPFFKNRRMKLSISHDGEYAAAVVINPVRDAKRNNSKR